MEDKMRSKILLVQVILMVSLFNISAGITYAEWPSDPTVNVPICTAAGNQENPKLASDGAAGGAIITWENNRSVNYDIYAQNVFVH
jgi:hypothetical protein